MYVLYLDDAGSPGNSTEDYFVLGGVCVFEAQIDWFSRELDKLATPFDKNPEDVEFHASTIFSRREAPWKSLSADEARRNSEVRFEGCGVELRYDARLRLRDS